MKKIGFIGTGNMGGALARAASKNSECAIMLANRHPEKAAALAESIGGTVCTNAEAAAEADYLFLGVKPQMIAGMLDGIKETLAARKAGFTLVTMAAGTPIARINELLGAEYPVIRIMPNTPAAIGEGMILYCCNGLVSPECEAEFVSLMANAGRFSKLDEHLIDAGSGVSGCGPAFVALFIEAMADGGVACGLPRKQALEFAAQTVAGTAKLMLESGQHPGQLKDAVCSPGGTTIQGVRVLEENGLRGAVMDAVIAAVEKNRDLH